MYLVDKLDNFVSLFPKKFCPTTPHSPRNVGEQEPNIKSQHPTIVHWEKEMFTMEEGS